jgi:ankyrin repeat protein
MVVHFGYVGSSENNFESVFAFCLVKMFLKLPQCAFPNLETEYIVYFLSLQEAMDLIETQEDFEIHFSLMIREHNLDALRICVYRYRSGAFPDTDINHFLCEAIQTGHIQVVKIVIVAPGVDLNYTDSYGKRMLHYASIIGVTDVVTLMIHCGTAVNAADAKGYTALHHACRYGQTETVKVLVKEGAHLNRVRSILQGESPLHLAVGGGFYETVEALIQLGARVNVISADDKKQTPLHKAITGKKYDVIRLLCENGADLSLNDAKGRTPLHLAAETGDIGTLCAILQLGFVDTSPDAEGRKPLHIAVRTKQQLVIEALVTAIPGDVNAQDRLGLTPLHVAAINCQMHTVQLFIDANADVNLKTSAGETALNIAVSFGNLSIVEVLLAAGACPNIPDEKGVTALHRAQVLKRECATLKNGVHLKIH